MDISCYQMKSIQDFQYKKENSCTMYTHLAQFIIELTKVFAKSELVKIFLSKIDNYKRN